jgi:hypothetical protein
MRRIPPKYATIDVVGVAYFLMSEDNVRSEVLP